MWKRVCQTDECSIERGKGHWSGFFDALGNQLGNGQCKAIPGFIEYAKCFGLHLLGIDAKDLVAMDGDPSAKIGGVTAPAYRTVFDKHLPTVLDADSIFMHDNERIYTAKHI
jgi:hypothetical protein